MPVCSNAKRWAPIIQVSSTGALWPARSGERTSWRKPPSRVSRWRILASQAFPSLNLFMLAWFFSKAQRSVSSAIAIDIEGIQKDLGLEIIYRPGFGLPVAGYVARDPALHCSERTTVSLSPASQVHNTVRVRLAP